ncbi:MAG: hypothetical protein C0395_09715 [Gemmatimonas sp.]|nr:hypothetical protein [Gemmatimonas sp.]
MNHEFRYDEVQDVIMGRVQGRLDAAVAKEVATDLARLVREHGCRFLLMDLRGVQITSSTLEIYMIPRVVKEAGVSSGIKRALVVAEITPDFDFLETTSVNAGNLVKLFTDPEAALVWLKG